MKLLILSHNANDATSFYRAAGPFNALRSQIQFTILPSGTKYGWSNMGEFDIVFLQRPYTDTDVSNAATAKQMGKKVWIDYDDLLTEVPRSNPLYFEYAKPKVKLNIECLIHMADALTFSTKTLMENFNLSPGIKKNKIVEVIPNAFDNTLFSFGKFSEKNDVVWRGSVTHEDDLRAYAADIISVMKDHGGQIHFIGDDPYFITSELHPDSVRAYQVMEVMSYFEFIKQGLGQIWIVPLRDNRFNRSKSNITWLEATMAGGCCVCPDWSEWVLACVLTYRNSLKNEFKKITSVKNSVRKNLYEWSVDTIKRELLLTTTNKQRLKIIDRLNKKPKIKKPTSRS